MKFRRDRIEQMREELVAIKKAIRVCKKYGKGYASGTTDEDIAVLENLAEIYNTNLMVEIESYISDSMKDMTIQVESVMMPSLLGADISLKDVFQMLDDARSALGLPPEDWEW